MYPLLDGSASLRRALVVGLLLGLGVLTKGPVVVVLAALGVLVYLALTRTSPLAQLKRPWPWIAGAVALGVAALWYVPAALIGGAEYRAVLFDENLGHFLPERLGGTGEAARPVYHIVIRAIGGALPCVLLIPSAVLAIGGGDLDPRARRAVLYQASLTLAVIAFFSLASTKRDDYILPALPGIAILAAAPFALLKPQSAAARLRDVTCLVAAAAVALAALASLVWLTFGPGLPIPESLHSSDRAFAEVYVSGFEGYRLPCLLFTAAAIAAFVLAIVGSAKRRAILSGAGLALAGIACSMLWTAELKPSVAQLRTLKPFAAKLRERVGNAPVYVVRGHNYELSFYYGAPVPPLIRRRVFHAPSELAYVVATDRELASLPPDVRRRMRLVFTSDQIGGGGPPALYALDPPEIDQGLKPLRRKIKWNRDG
jgi:hypothetical protein